LTLALAEWGYWAVKMLHSQTSPSLQAIQYLQRTLDPKNDVLLFDGLFDPHVNFYLPNINKVERAGDFPPEINLINAWAHRPRLVELTANPHMQFGLHHFDWELKRGARRLQIISLGRYFDVYVVDRTNEQGVVFLDGWWPLESTPELAWRWMGPKGKVALLGATEQMRLRFKGGSGLPPTPTQRPTITLRLNGVAFDRFTVNERLFDHTVMVKTDPARLWSTLEIEVDKPGVPSQFDPNSSDHRALGLSCHVLEWKPVSGSPSIVKAPDQFLGEGWHGFERNETAEWRSTKGVSVIHLPQIDGAAQLDLRARIVNNQLPPITVEIAGQVVAKIQPEGNEITRSLHVPLALHGGKPVDLKLSVQPAGGPDGREFGLQVVYLGWRPVENYLK
jgi:hypothetical protein